MILYQPWNATRSQVWFKLAPNTGVGTGTPDTDTDTEQDADPEAELAAYKALGLSPTEVTQVVKTLAKLSQERDEVKQTTDPAPTKRAPNPKFEQNKDAIREDLLSLFPGLSNLSQLEALVKKTTELEEHTKHEQARNYADTQEAARDGVYRYVTGTLNADVDTAAGKKFLSTVLQTVSDRVGANYELLGRFAKGDKGVVKHVLGEMSKTGFFDQFNYPRVKTRSPYVNGADGSESEIKSIMEANAEKYAKLPSQRRFAEISKDTFDHVWRND